MTSDWSKWLQQGDARCSGDRDRLVAVLLEQYSSFRAEIREDIRGLFTVMTVLGTIVVTAMAAGFYLWPNALACCAIFSVAIPGIIAVAALAMLLVTLSMASAGAYIKRTIEEPIEYLLGPEYRKWLQEVGLAQLGDDLAGLDRAEQGGGAQHGRLAAVRLAGWETWVSTSGQFAFVLRYAIALLVVLFLVPTTFGQIRAFVPSDWGSVPCLLKLSIQVAPLLIMVGAYVVYRAVLKRMPRVT